MALGHTHKNTHPESRLNDGQIEFPASQRKKRQGQKEKTNILRHALLPKGEGKVKIPRCVVSNESRYLFSITTHLLRHKALCAKVRSFCYTHS